MNYFVKFLFSVVVLILTGMSFAQGNSVPMSTMNIQCDSFYKCLSESEMKSLVGKTLKYRHPFGVQFGIVTVRLRPDGTAYGENQKGLAGDGPWEIQKDTLLIKFSRWGDSSFRFVRIDPSSQIFYFVDSQNRALLIPIEVTD